MSLLKIDVDPGNVLSRTFTDLEQKNLPFALQQAANNTGFEIKAQWERHMPRVFDRPTPRTLRAIQIQKARYRRGSDGTRINEAAVVLIRDDGVAGAAGPAAWLAPQVQGGQRPLKGLERGLQRKGFLGTGEFAVPGQGAPMDAYGNIRGGVVQQILSQLGAQFDSLANQTETSKARRAVRKTNKRGEVFALRRQHGRLRPGVYERFAFGRRTIVRSLFVFVKGVRYAKRYEIFEIAQRTYNRVMPFHFERELAKAVQTSIYRGRA